MADVLLAPHANYVMAIRRILDAGIPVKGMAHITGGGITGNLPRALPAKVQAVIDLDSWPVLPVFRYLARLGKIERDELLQTFNMGVGMILVVPKLKADAAQRALKRSAELPWVIGEIVPQRRGRGRVIYSH